MKLQASSIHRAMQCPASVQLEADTPENFKYKPFQGAADFGTRCHEVAESILQQEFILNNGQQDIKKYIKDQFTDPDEYDRAYNAVNHYVKHFRKVARSARHKGITTLHLIEEKFRYIDKKKDFEAVAKADAAIVTFKKDGLYMDFFDLKTGNFDYSVSAVDQIFFGTLVYLISSSLNFTSSVKIFLSIHVVQPNYWNAPDKVFTKVIEPFSYHDVIFRLSIYYRKVLSGQVNHGDHCRFCSSVLVCPAIRARVDYTTAVMNAGAPGESMDLAMLENLYIMKPAVELFFKAVESVAFDQMEKGEPFQSLQVAYTSGHRRWIDEKIVEEKLSFLGDDLYTKKIKTPAQIEKLAGKENISELYITPKIKKLVPAENPFKTGEN